MIVHFVIQAWNIAQVLMCLRWLFSDMEASMEHFLPEAIKWILILLVQNEAGINLSISQAPLLPF